MAGPLQISVQGTPNPNATKFTLNRVVATQGKTYRLPAAPANTGSGTAQAGEAARTEAEWARQLLGIAGVTQIFVMNNFLSVTKTPDATWDTIVPQVEAVLRRTLA